MLILFLAVILPNLLLAAWIGWSARGSALTLLEAQLHERLAEAAKTIGHRWVEIRSPLITLAQDPRLAAALHAAPAAEPTRLEDDDLWNKLGDIVQGVTILDAQGRTRAVLPMPEGRTVQGGSPAVLPVRIPVFDEEGKAIGTVEATISLSQLLPPLYGWGGAAGAVPALLSSDGTPLVPVAMEPLRLGVRRFSWDGQEWLSAQRDVHDPPFRLALAAPTALHTTPFVAAARRGVVALVLVMTGSVLLILLLSRSVSLPVARLTRAAEDVAGGQLDVEARAWRGPDEIRRLGRAFDTMTASLQRLIRRISQQESAAAVGEFAATLAHEVRNPLTSVRLDLERAREQIHEPRSSDELLARALHQVERLDATVSGALRLARSGSLELSLVDIRQPFGAAQRTAAVLFEARRLHLAPSQPPDHTICVRGNAAAIEQMLLNLLLNAADAVEDGGRQGCVKLEIDENESDVTVSVRDDGRGMSPEEVQRAREPFYTTRAEGTGLGLTVVQRVAQVHDAQVEIRSDVGKGTTVTVVFPRSDSDLNRHGS